MSSDDELLETLNRLGRAEGPSPDPAFANRLDAHLRTIQGDQEPSRGIRSLVVLSALGLVGVVLAALLSMSLIGGEPAVVVLTAAAQTEVVLPGEAAVEGIPGQRLPDGTRIVVNAGGEAVVGGVVLDQGTEALVVRGRIEVLGDDDADEAVATTRPILRPEPADSLPPSSAPERPGDTSTPTTASPPEPSDPGTTAPPPDDPVTSPTTSPDRDGTATTAATTSPPTTSPTTAPTTTDRPRTTSTTRPATTTSTPRPSTTDSRPRPEPAIELTVTATAADRVVLDWTVEGAPDPDRWRIEAIAGDRVATLVVLRDGAARSTTVARIDARRVGFRVVALDADDNPLLTSRIVSQPPA